MALRPAGQPPGFLACRMTLFLPDGGSRLAPALAADRDGHRKRLALGILRGAIAEGPVLLGHLDQIDEHVLRTQAWVAGKPIDDALVQRLLLLDAAGVADGELDDHEIVAPLDAEVM